MKKSLIFAKYILVIMNIEKTLCGLIMIAVTSVALHSCGNADGPSTDSHAVTSADTSCVGVYDEEQLLSDALEDSLTTVSVDAECAEQEEAPKPKATPKSVAKKTIYVSGYGANGEVWGHVTMTGDKGRGTIHDSEENTLSVTCYRQGGELIAVDQNSRQYVFKI